MRLLSLQVHLLMLQVNLYMHYVAHLVTRNMPIQVPHMMEHSKTTPTVPISLSHARRSTQQNHPDHPGRPDQPVPRTMQHSQTKEFWVYTASDMGVPS